MKLTSLGKFRALQQCSTPAGSFAILAADHRGNLLEALQKHSPTPITDSDFTAFKGQIIESLAVAGSAVLLDPEYSAAQLIASNTISGQRGLLTGVEKTGYSGDPTARENSLLPDWGVAKAKRAGVSGIKLLVHYHPASPTASQIEALVQQVIDDCAASEIPLYLEPLSYSPYPNKDKISSAERREVVIEGAKRFSAMGIDILKAEFPLDVASDTDEAEWERACADLSIACAVPWILLSGSTAFETYIKQVTAACRNGASGVAVGRAIWQESIPMSNAERENFFKHEALRRMQRVTALCDALARPWTDFYQVGELTTTWYVNY
ncbi:MAG: tagatose 1,6-diphosphate aldolase [Chloroflexi bacterium]|nr:tagatose 1,6-diphosphate aldolase [Chloroflexota bacterium]MCC6894076.1 tagatose 1,6-diphosphate aldolase [Anaerolineae bacterium]